MFFAVDNAYKNRKALNKVHTKMTNMYILSHSLFKLDDWVFGRNFIQLFSTCTCKNKDKNVQIKILKCSFHGYRLQKRIYASVSNLDA